MPESTALEQYLTDHRQQFEDDLCELLRIPSVSADRNYAGDIRRAADWVAARLRRLGLATQVVETGGHPLVYAESPPVPGAPTVLVYGHYDVQPADPLDQWTSPPFEPTVRDGNLYARGATDDKGQLLTHINSAQAWIETAGRLPLQLKFLIEGEEEVGSESLNKFLEQAADQLACDVVVVSDTAQFAPGQPAITYGLRGIAYFELRLTGPQHDLHSGTFGGGVTNPANALARMLAALVDDDGRVQVPGFYDDVVPLTDRERAQFAALAFDERAFLQRIGADAATGEAGYTTLERRWARPTCDVNGIWGGYQGQGGKTVLPSTAGAKFSFRLVPRQDPRRVAAGLRELFTRICPPGIRMELIEMHGAPGALVSLDSPYMQAAARAIERGFEQKPVFIREGGSIPIVTAFYERLGADTLLLGWGLDDDNAHGPNEKFSLTDFHRGIRASTYLWQELVGRGV
ncbi:MAG: dipeptidase [Candidatus Anammoximicrobium sp.]|nr:dipeptidase [Candidatus Anammoximicrobium sp.]